MRLLSSNGIAFRPASPLGGLSYLTTLIDLTYTAVVP